MAEDRCWQGLYKNYTTLSIGFISAAADGSSSLLPDTKPLFTGAFLLPMTFTVYILYSSAHQKHYTGFTTNVAQRMLSHNELGKDWTSKFRPWQLIFTKEFNNKKEATDYEKWLKTGVGRDFIKTIPH